MYSYHVNAQPEARKLIDDLLTSYGAGDGRYHLNILHETFTNWLGNSFSKNRQIGKMQIVLNQLQILVANISGTISGN